MPALLQLMTSLVLVLALVTPLFVLGFDPSRNDNVAVYWGQNSFGATELSDRANWQKRLSFYCQDDSIDVLPLAFLDVAFDAGNLPSIDLSNICNTGANPVFAETALPDCSFLASDIQECQAKGKIVTLSIGGETSDVGFVSDSQAEQFADTIWDLFLGGSSSMRPFGNAILDGVDLDLEAGTGLYWSAFVNQIRSHANRTSTGKKYYITGAPQCPFPDVYLGPAINAVGFDAVYVQFYNNYCGLQAFNDPNAWNFARWDEWANTVSPNKDVKVYIGAPAGTLAASHGYVDADTLTSYAVQMRNQFPSFGGIMLWDASWAYANDDFAATIKNALLVGGNSAPKNSSAPRPGPSAASTQSSSTSSPSSSPSSGSCGAVAPWVANVSYKGGNQVSYAGHIWTAKWWNNDEAPGGSSGVWKDMEPCNPAEDRRRHERRHLARGR